jgi:hypothetical protein
VGWFERVGGSAAPATLRRGKTVLGDPTTDLDLSSSRTIGQILGTGLRLYLQLPLLFLFLAGIVVVPYEVVVVLLEHGNRGASVGTELVLLLVELALIDPCVAAVQVQAVLDLGDGQRPQVRDVIRRGLAVLPVVAAAEIVAGIGIALGAVFFIIPGVILAIRWAVVAQAAAVEHTDWPGALRRGAELARHNYWRILGLVLIVGILNQIPADVTSSGKHTVATIIGIALAILVHSYGTLVMNLLYFDLRVREATAVG